MRYPRRRQLSVMISVGSENALVALLRANLEGALKLQCFTRVLDHASTITTPTTAQSHMGVPWCPAAIVTREHSSMNSTTLTQCVYNLIPLHYLLN
ncbi:hypothetical protein RSOLAG1IB_02298 [Rhizoctonia solani AG-1 IB]|uniref:Uncharacterized protein n=1 Tax=Thanatephorus cucumeris (strain AG1-IB / isolate 7/3/14) TaxID=1108050 RepID=A0A0B7FHY4_THACB|nr:hypothetical protein RSOLAG1IB_02298 [Rhizoctonia solani AG-1 IB]